MKNSLAMFLFISKCTGNLFKTKSTTKEFNSQQIHMQTINARIFELEFNSLLFRSEYSSSSGRPPLVLPSQSIECSMAPPVACFNIIMREDFNCKYDLIPNILSPSPVLLALISWIFLFWKYVKEELQYFSNRTVQF